jgi:CRP/FNR family transcriptional regulator, cyclic AMP receptor protein
MPQDSIDLLQAMPLFGGVSEASLHLLLRSAQKLVLSRGEFFFREHEPGASMFVLREGRVGIVKSWAGRDYLLRYLEAGDCFGEMALLDLYPRSASIVAVDKCTAIEIPTDSLHQLYQHDLEQFALIFMNIGRELSRRLRDADQRLFERAMAPRAADDPDLPRVI